MRSTLSAALLPSVLSTAFFVVASLGLAGCSSGDDSKNATDGGSEASIAAKVVRFTPVNTADPVGELSMLLGGRRGYCVQFRALPEKADALALARRIETETGISVALIEAKIKGRGTWYRLCGGVEDTVIAATKKANGWTATGGKLATYMEPTAPGQARYFVKERPVSTLTQPTEPQARLILAARPDATRQVMMVELATAGSLAVVTTPKDEKRRTSILAVDPRGHTVEVVGVGAPGCAACAAALASSPVVEKRLLGVGDVHKSPGGEVFIEERTERNSRILVVATQSVDDNGRLQLKRTASFWLGTEQQGMKMRARVETVQANGSPQQELALVLTEMPTYRGKLCALRQRVEIYDLSTTPPRALDERYMRATAVIEDATNSGAAAIRLVSVLDRLGDYRSASRMCAAYLSRGQDVGLTQHCIARIGWLTKTKRTIAAVNAAGMLAESAESLRAVVAGPFFDAVKALNKDPRLTVADENCLKAPLVDDVDKRSLAQTLRLARAAQRERRNLASVTDSVFVTGARDFGTKTPVGKITNKWLERLRIALPARFAAIEALLAEAPDVDTLPSPHKRIDGLGVGVEEGVERTNDGDPERARSFGNKAGSLDKANLERPKNEQAVDQKLGRPRIILKVHDELGSESQ